MIPAICWLVLAVPAYVFLRFVVAGRMHERAVKVVLEHHSLGIEAGIWNEDWADEDWHMLRTRLQKRVLDPRCWTFKSFYPELA